MRHIKSLISVSTTIINLYFNDTKLASGSGFFYKSGSDFFLVTNRHNLTGRDQNTGEALSSYGGIPNRLEFFIPTHSWDGPNLVMDGQTLNSHAIIWGADSRPWLEHPTLASDCDIVALHLNSFGNDVQPVVCVNTLQNSAPLTMLPAARVSVVGYPFGTQINGHLPIWISGSIASEPELDVEGKAAFFIDCRTNRGASGSPVFLVNLGSSQMVDHVQNVPQTVTVIRSGNHNFATFAAPVQRFIGIYSGRINAKSDIGLVWRTSLIEEICSQGTKAASPWQ